MRIPYRYVVRTIHGAAKLESELSELSRDGWEPVHFEHDASGTYEVILRQEQDEQLPVVDHLEASVVDIAAIPVPSQDLLQEAKAKTKTIERE